MPYDYAPLVLVVLGGVLFAVGAWIGPETVTGGTLTDVQAQVRVDASLSTGPATAGGAA
jgi:hypothetical protein